MQVVSNKCSKTVIEFSFLIIPLIIKPCVCVYLPQSLALADDSDLGTDNS